MEFIHAASVVHLDIKPENIFIGIDGRFVIGDFGLASEWPRQDTSGFEREGDKQYLAAEVLQGVYGKAADIFRFVGGRKGGHSRLTIYSVLE